LQKTETELTVLSALHEGIVRSLNSGILTVDGAARITYLNPAGEDICDVHLRDLRGTRLADTMPAFAEALRRSQPGRGELQLARKDGTVRIVGYNQSPLVESATGSLPGQVIVFQDLSNLRRLEEAMRRSDKLAAVGKLSAGLAHEIRNPLASMTGSIQILATLPALSEKERKLMQIVLREGERLEALVKDFLAFARPVPPVLAQVPMSAMAEEILALFKPTAEGRGLSLESQLAPQLEVHADEGQLRQVLWNLLGNAADATPQGGAITVRLFKSNFDVRLEIEDTGPGISPEDLGRIFDPFFTTKEKGSGLGLAIVHRVVEAHGGRVEVRGAAAQGSVFTVVLPLARPGEGMPRPVTLESIKTPGERGA
ncbi:MAG: PAS domain-containing protein, partial [Deltaproteobacteria bacterium]|nr:PAS domain-containing protein [Deltaproteobacteria bacterium]